MRLRSCFIVLLALTACAPPVPGPDKQFGGGLEGAALGAGTGAVTGFQVGAGTGPGAAIGAGFGAIAGGISGAIKDSTEEQMLKVAAQTREQREVAWAHEIMADQYKRRLELHPTREIYPADLFFYGDESKLRSSAKPLVRELAQMNKQRLPWSRLVIASYAKGVGSDASYAQELADRRSRAIVNELVHDGLEPRRLVARGVVVDAPILIDPDDDPLRYDQAVEIIALDR
ncbi:MAG: OmpA family protein [Deltaproteobacteria bacterium]|nr:OmpA family protein [Deltaproteobacteria bacterium]